MAASRSRHGPDGDLVGDEAVIDKDATAAVLAEALDANALLLLTAVDAVRLDFGLPTEHAVHEHGADLDAEKHLADGQFPPGSMGPKIGRGGAVRWARRRTGGDHLGPAARGDAGRPARHRHPDRAAGRARRRPAMTVIRVLAHRDRYRDSLVLLAATATMSEVPGVEWAAAVMAAAPRGDA